MNKMLLFLILISATVLPIANSQKSDEEIEGASLIHTIETPPSAYYEPVFLLLFVVSLYLGIASIVKSNFKKSKRLPFLARTLMPLSYFSVLLGLLLSTLCLIKQFEDHLINEDATIWEYAYSIQDSAIVLVLGVSSALIFLLFYFSSVIRFEKTKSQVDK